MDLDRARIEDDLRGLLEGQVRCDDTFLQMYASDASLYEIKPLGVVRPNSTADVVACVNYARENQISIVPRGAGSNVSGAAIGDGLILDFSYSMRRVLSVDRNTVTVQPGLVLGALNQQLASHGKIFGPDPMTRNVTTIGGLLSLNSTGSHWLKSGSPRDQVVSLQIVLACGDVIRVDSQQHVKLDSLNSGTTDATTRNYQSLTVQNQVKQVLQQNAETINKSKPNTKINQAGYNVFDIIKGGRVDLTRLIVGSEGTLGIITEATLKTVPVPRHRGVALLFFHRLSTAAQTAIEIAKMGAVACDMLDRRLLRLARETGEANRAMIPDGAEAMLLVEFDASDDVRLREKLDDLIRRVVRRKKWAFDYQMTTQKDRRDLFWRLARRVVPTLYRMQGNRRAIPFVEDIGINPEQLPAFLKSAHAILNKNEITASVFSHTPQGTIHIRPFVTITDKSQVAKMHRVATELYEKVIEFNGTISANCGDGLSRTYFLKRQYGDATKVFREIKDIFDPDGLLNPGKIIGGPHHGLTDDLRSVQVDASLASPSDSPSANADLNPGFRFRRSLKDSPENSDHQDKTEKITAGKTKTGKNGALPILAPELNWSLSEIALAAQNCNGCGRCRTSVKLERMCPVFRLSPREEASPRAKANLMRAVVTGQLSKEQLTDEEFKSVADLCVNCHQCRFECPAQVDIPKLVVEAKAQYLAVNGMKLSDWLLARVDWMYEIAGQMPWLVNRCLQNKSMRWLLDRTLGIAQGRKLPRFAPSTFQKWAAKKKLDQSSSSSSRKIVYFVDAFANWNDIELGQAFCKIMAHNKVDVLVPPGQGIAGMSLISSGAIPRAKKIAARNIEMLADWVRQGYQIVTTEPSAALAIKHEYLNFLDDQDAALVAANTTDSSTYLFSLHEAGELELDFRPINATVGYHLPCHQRALIEANGSSQIPGIKLLEIIPGLQVTLINQGCSGMAGTYGIKRQNYMRSLRMGVELIQAMRSPTITVGATECSTCKIQMEQGTRKSTTHPVKLLAMAYGLMPELKNLLKRRSEELTIS